MTDLHLQHLTAEELRYYAMKLEEQVAALQTLGGAAVAQVGSRETGEYAQAAVVVRRLAGLVHRTHALLAADHGHATVVTEAECLLARVEDLVAPRRSGYRPDPTIPTVPLDELKPTGTAVVRPDPIRLKPSELWMRLSPEERVALLDEACAADAIARECDEQIAALRAEVERWKTAYEGREKYEGTEEIVRKWTTDPLYAGETGASDVLHLCATVNRLHEQLDAKRRSHAEYVEAHGKQAASWQCIHDYLHRYGVGEPGGNVFRQIVDDAERLRTRDSNLTAHDRNVMAVNEHLNGRLKETQSRLEHLLSFLRGTESGS